MKLMKKILWIASVVFTLFFIGTLVVVNNLKHGKLYEFTGKYYTEEEKTVTNDQGIQETETEYIIVTGQLKIHFIDEYVIKIAIFENGKLQSTTDGLYNISDGYLYVSTGEEYELIGEIDSYEIKPTESNRLTDFQIYECEENKNIKTISIVGICVGLLFIIINTVITVKELKKAKQPNAEVTDLVETEEKK